LEKAAQETLKRGCEENIKLYLKKVGHAVAQLVEALRYKP
jgi:hypothetical protein